MWAEPGGGRSRRREDLVRLRRDAAVRTDDEYHPGRIDDARGGQRHLRQGYRGRRVQDERCATAGNHTPDVVREAFGVHGLGDRRDERPPGALRGLEQVPRADVVGVEQPGAGQND